MNHTESVQKKRMVRVRGVRCGRMWRASASRIFRERGEREGRQEGRGASRRLSRREGDGDRRPWGAEEGWKRGEVGLREEEYELYESACGLEGDSAVDGMLGKRIDDRRREESKW